MTYTPISQERWQRGSEHELKFWRGWLDDNADKYTSPRPLVGYLADWVVLMGKADILDAGSGAACLIGQHTSGTMTACDIWGNEYMGMWRDMGKVPVVPIERQDLSNLTYADNSFDIVHCSNALDHCRDPKACLIEMARVCKPNGLVYLRHMKDVGRCSRYHGLHQWNVTRLDNHEVRVWRSYPAESNEFLVSDCLPNCVSRLRRDRPEQGTKIIVRWRKP